MAVVGEDEYSVGGVSMCACGSLTNDISLFLLYLFLIFLSDSSLRSKKHYSCLLSYWQVALFLLPEGHRYTELSSPGILKLKRECLG